jgi:hypothetical protein
MTVNQAQFTRAMKAALEGPEVKKVKPERHEFNVKPIKVEKLADGLKIIGEDGHHISHHLSFRPDDQVRYTAMVNNDGVLQSLDVKVKSSWEQIKELGSLAAAIVGFFASAKADDAALSPIPGTELLLDGKWRGEADFLIANIVAHAARKHLKRKSSHIAPKPFVEGTVFGEIGRTT